MIVNIRINVNAAADSDPATLLSRIVTDAAGCIKSVEGVESIQVTQVTPEDN